MRPKIPLHHASPVVLYRTDRRGSRDAWFRTHVPDHRVLPGVKIEAVRATALEFARTGADRNLLEDPPRLPRCLVLSVVNGLVPAVEGRRGVRRRLLQHAHEVTAITNPTVNSYKRLVPGPSVRLREPCAQQRSALVRVPVVIKRKAHSTRVEHRP